MDPRTALIVWTGRSMLLALKLLRIELAAADAGRRLPDDFYVLARDARAMNASLGRAVEKGHASRSSH
jgi:hypothetical protein